MKWFCGPLITLLAEWDALYPFGKPWKIYRERFGWFVWKWHFHKVSEEFRWKCCGNHCILSFSMIVSLSLCSLHFLFGYLHYDIVKDFYLISFAGKKKLREVHFLFLCSDFKLSGIWRRYCFSLCLPYLPTPTYFRTKSFQECTMNPGHCWQFIVAGADLNSLSWTLSYVIPMQCIFRCAWGTVVSGSRRTADFGCHYPSAMDDGWCSYRIISCWPSYNWSATTLATYTSGRHRSVHRLSCGQQVCTDSRAHSTGTGWEDTHKKGN